LRHDDRIVDRVTASILEAVLRLRVDAVSRPALLAFATFVVLAVVIGAAGARVSTPLLWRALAASVRVAGTSALAVYVFVALFYVIDPHYVDSAEPTMASIGWLFHIGQPVYHVLDSAERYSHIYGPMPFMIQGAALAWLGPSVFVSKTVGVAAGLASVIILIVTLRLTVPRSLTWRAAGLCTLAFLLFRHYTFWTRAEPLQILCVASALAVSLRGRGYTAAVALGLWTGVLWNMKITGPLYSLPIFAVFLSRAGWSPVVVATASALVTMALPFLILPNVSWDLYVAWFRMSAQSGLQVRSFLINVEWAVFLLAPLALARVCASATRDAGARQDRLATLGLVVGMAGLAVAASKPGAGPYHLVPFLPIITWMTAATIGATPTVPDVRRLVPVASLALLVVTIGLAAAQQLQWLQALVGRRGILDREDLAEFIRTHDGVIEMGYGSDEPLTLGRPVLVFHSNSYLIDQPAVREHQLAGVEIPPATVAALRSCRITYWLVPKGNEPFSAHNAYPQTGFAPLYPDEFRRAFFESYARASSTAYFDVWQCRAAVR
jgi:hypothetical protein